MNIKILYIQYTNPAYYPPLQHSSRILAQGGWLVLFLGISVSGTKDFSFPLHDRITLQNLPLCSSDWQKKLHYLWFCLWVISSTIRWKPQWVYASDLLSCPIALLLSLLPGTKVIYHEHDSPASAPNSPFIRLCLMTRKCLARRAQMCILPNQQRIERFIQGNQPTSSVMCVWNCPAQEEISPLRSPKGKDLWVLYHGSIGSSRLPPSVLTALAKLPVTVKLRVIGYETQGSQGYVQQLKELAHQLGISERIEFLGAMPRKELFKWCQKSDIGLAFMPIGSKDINMEHMVGASNKVFDYLACGLALLVSDLPDWRKMYVDSGYGLTCKPDDPESIATAVNWFIENPKQMRQMGELGRQRIATDWNYDQQLSPVLERMNAVNTMDLFSPWSKSISQLLRFLPPQLRGKSRLARFLLGSTLQAQNVKIRDRNGCIFILPTLREPVGFHLLVDGVYEVDAVNLLLSQLKAGSVFIDVGANIGAFTLTAAKKVGSEGCVLAIEPSPSIFPYLKQNVTLNHLLNVRLVQCAAFDKETQVPFYEAPIEKFGMGSIAAQFNADPVIVSAQTLDHILKKEKIAKVDILKVDVEGFEAAVFRGAEQLLTCDNPPLILFEFCDWAEARWLEAKVGDAQRLLQEWGYKLWRIEDFMYKKPPLANVITHGYEILVAIKA